MNLKVFVSMTDSLKFCVFLIVIKVQCFFTIGLNSYQEVKVRHFRFVPEVGGCLDSEGPMKAGLLFSSLPLKSLPAENFKSWRCSQSH